MSLRRKAGEGLSTKSSESAPRLACKRNREPRCPKPGGDSREWKEGELEKDRMADWEAGEKQELFGLSCLKEFKVQRDN